eukprot:365260-Chlamydomonas_euryale.AAC.7
MVGWGRHDTPCWSNPMPATPTASHIPCWSHLCWSHPVSVTPPAVHTPFLTCTASRTSRLMRPSTYSTSAHPARAYRMPCCR